MLPIWHRSNIALSRISGKWALIRSKGERVLEKIVTLPIMESSEKERDLTLDEDAAKTMLEERGIHTPRRRVCTTRAEARTALAELSGVQTKPVVVKVLDAAFPHKSDVGGVHLNITSPTALESALDAIDRLAPDRPLRYLIEEMLPSGLELIIGGTRNPSFGPTILVGLGGVVAEVLHDVSLRLAPLTSADASEMLDELAGRALLDGYRGQAGTNRADLIQVLLTISNLLATHPEITELDINPLRATTGGLYALDALIILNDAQT